MNGDGYADVIVGARDYDNGQTNEGGAFVFLGSATGVADANVTTAHARLESDQGGGELGWDVDTAGDVNGDGYSDVMAGAIIAGAGQADEGLVFIWHGSASGIVANGNPTNAATQLETDQVSAQLFSVGGGGDVNGDGYGDVIVGARFWDGGQTDEGGAWVFFGRAGGIPDGNTATADVALEADQAGGGFGFDTALAGDVNGDGFADVLVGANLFDDAFADSGAAFVFLGGNEGIVDGDALTAATTVETNQADAWLGYSIASAGDINGDGYGDVVIGAPRYDTGTSVDGAVFIFHGGAAGIASGLDSSADTQILGQPNNSFFGTAVASAGDVNGDGYGDVIVGDPGYGYGAAWIFHGGPGGIASGTAATADGQIEANSYADAFGTSVAAAGDVDGDGFGDVIVGAPGLSHPEVLEGGALVFRGSAMGIPAGSEATAYSVFESNIAWLPPPFGYLMEFGSSVSGAGDVNGDGYSDVIVGSPRSTPPGPTSTEGGRTSSKAGRPA